MTLCIHIALVRLLCPLTEKKDKRLSAHNQIDAGNLLSNVLTFKAIGQGATRNAGEDYWPWPGRSPIQAQPLFVMIK